MSEVQATATEIAKLYSDWLAWRALTEYVRAQRIANVYRRNPSLNAERKAGLAEMIRCHRSAGRDPRLWLFLMFQVRAWRFAPELNKSHLCNEKRWAERYEKAKRALRHDPLYREQLALAQTTPLARDFDPRVDLDTEAEARKARYIIDGQAERCMDEMDSWTYGWHPQSVACSTCSLAESCRKALDRGIGYPLSRVRTGELLLEEAVALR